ncbi:hypothetical protein JKF63_01787 [Porcisia hertigi]|uniref:Uncharacterized protein n=1 Tax=Porcisia hertigi TaxID=2761500 RepID=A0A836L4A0_9TRYP|nr:hypothetical protein JKF63_01787 [Porcisia hertigi]
MGRRILVYQCGTRSVVNLKEPTSRSCGSVSSLPAPSSLTPLQGSGYRGANSVVDDTITDAHESSRSNSPYSSVALNMATGPGVDCGVEGALLDTTPSPAPRLPPPQALHRKADDMLGIPEGGPVQALSQRSTYHSPQGVSPSPFEGDTYNHSDSAAHPGSDYHLSSFAECPLGSVRVPSNPVPLPFGQRSGATPVNPAAVRGAPGGAGFCLESRGHGAMCVLTQSTSELENASPTGQMGSEGHATTHQCTIKKRSLTFSHPCRCREARPSPPLLQSNIEGKITVVAVAGAERVLFGDDNFMDMSATSCRCFTSRQEVPQPPVLPCAAIGAVAHTPRRLSDEESKARTTSQQSTSGGCEGVHRGKDEHFSLHLTATSVSSYIEPGTDGSSNAVAKAERMVLLDKTTPNDCGQVRRSPAIKVVMGDVEKSAPMAGENETEGTPYALTALTRTRGIVSAAKTPISSPHRQELSSRFLAAKAASAVDTPTAHTCSSSPSLPTAGVLATPLPQHASHRWRGSSSTPGWESQAQTTGFPTPVKLSPIPTKGYVSCPGPVSTAVAEAAPVTLSSTPRASLTSSPVVSEIHADAHEIGAEKREAGMPSTKDSPFQAAEKATGGVGETAVLWMPEMDDVLPKIDNDIADYLSSGRSISTISSGCSVSPIFARAGQTTRAWTPIPSDVSQQQQLATRPSSSTDCRSFRFLSGFPSSFVVQVPTPQQHQRSSMRNTTLVGATSLSPLEDTFYDHSNPSRVAVRSGQTAKEVSEDLAAMSALFTEVQRQPRHRQPRHPQSLYSPTGDPVLMDRHAELSVRRGPPTPHLAADTVNLGTPAVSIIQSTAQALNESCSSLSMPPSTQYIQALPIPGLQPRNVPITEAAQSVALAVESVGDGGDRVARTYGVSQGPRGKVHWPALMSPALDDSEGEMRLPFTTSAPLPVEQQPQCLPVPPPVSFNANRSLHAQHHRFSLPQDAWCNASQHPGSYPSLRSRAHAVCEKPSPLHSPAPPAQRYPLSSVSQWQQLSSGEVFSTPPQAGQPPHLELSPAKGESQSVDESPMRCPSTLTTAHSSTHVIDSWLCRRY